MQAYASSARLPPGDQLRALDRTSLTPVPGATTAGDPEAALLEQILGHLADLVVDRLMARTEPESSNQSEWLDARGVAAYLGIHRDTLRKLAAQRAIRAHQDGPRCKLYFRQDELDNWRRSTRCARVAVGLRAVS
jgi:excisionase family DNA binding protein